MKVLENIKPNSTIGVAMSGGVDSSVTAYLLKKQGFNVFGVTMRTTEKNVDSDAKKVCDDLGIKHYVFDIREKFSEKVINYFINEYNKGRTPNPCMVCNKYIKMGALIDFCIDNGAEYMATGHYSNVCNGVLKVGDDAGKDQVYFLSQVPKEKFNKIIFPLGEFNKDQVRKMGKELGVRVYSKKDSQEICFVEDGKLHEFLVERTNGNIIKPGNFVDKEGNILGKHKGLAFYTIGQRKGLGLSSSSPYYVLKLDGEKNEVVLGNNKDLFKSSLIGDNINLLKINSLDELNNLNCYAKTRSRDKFHPCKIELLNENEIKVVFTEDKVRAVTPGQGVVFYDDAYEVVASAFIKK